MITPRAIPGLHMSIDYWNIKIADAVQTPNPSDIVSKCVDLSDINNVFCSLITRGGAVFGGDEYTISNVNVADINIGKLSARGVDWQIEYNFTAASLIDSWNGDITLNLTGTYLDKLEELVDPTEPNSLLVEDGEGDDPHWRANFDITYVNGPLAVNWNMRYIGSAVADVQLPERYEDPEIAAKIYNDLFISYDLTDRYNVFLGINNVFDEIPPRNPLVFRNGFGDGALHDNIGRYFFVGGKFRF